MYMCIISGMFFDIVTSKKSRWAVESLFDLALCDKVYQ